MVLSEKTNILPDNVGTRTNVYICFYISGPLWYPTSDVAELKHTNRIHLSRGLLRAPDFPNGSKQRLVSYSAIFNLNHKKYLN